VDAVSPHLKKLKINLRNRRREPGKNGEKREGMTQTKPVELFIAT
jgi:hypothetical protein